MQMVKFVCFHLDTAGSVGQYSNSAVAISSTCLSHSGLLRVAREELPVDAPFHGGSFLPQCQVGFREGMEDLLRLILPRRTPKNQKPQKVRQRNGSMNVEC